MEKLHTLDDVIKEVQRLSDIFSQSHKEHKKSNPNTGVLHAHWGKKVAYNHCLSMLKELKTK